MTSLDAILTPAFFNCARNSSISSGCGTDKHKIIQLQWGIIFTAAKRLIILNMLIENG